MEESSLKPVPAESVYVYELPVRIWHWVNALSILVLCITGYLIGAPPPTVSGEASAHFLFGDIRFIHFVAAYALMVGFLARVYWAWAGNAVAREIFVPPVYKKSFWNDFFHELRWYALIEKAPRQHEGHNPLALLSMHFLFVWCVVFMMITGMALYGQGTGPDSWQYHLFTSWVIPLFGQSQRVHTLHHLGMWVIVCFVIIHIYASVREEIMSRQSIISSMVSGWRAFRKE